MAITNLSDLIAGSSVKRVTFYDTASPGSGIYVPVATNSRVLVRMMGGGGGAAGGGKSTLIAAPATPGGGGGGAAYLEIIMTLNGNTSYSIGAGGAGTAGVTNQYGTSTTGAQGGSTVFSYRTCVGGLGGNAGMAYQGSAGQGGLGGGQSNKSYIYAGSDGTTSTGVANSVGGQGGGITFINLTYGKGGGCVYDATVPQNGSNGIGGFLEIWDYGA